VQNRRNVQVGSHDNQQKPRPGKDGFLHHTRLGLVGWISYWCFGDSALVVFILVVLIKTLGLTELVSDSLANRKQKEAETNAKIVAKCGQVRRRLTCGLDTFGSPNSGRFLVA
jgi:hypothetical protein